MQRIDKRYYGIEIERGRNLLIGHQSLNYRDRIREPGRFDQHAIKAWHQAVLAFPISIGEGIDEITPHRATQAAVRKQAHVFTRRRDEQMINADFTEFIDDDKTVREFRVLQQMIQERRLTAAQKPGDQ